MLINDLKEFSNISIGIKDELSKFNSNELLSYINDILNYLEVFDKLDIDEIDTFSLFLNKLKQKIKKIDISKVESNKFNEIIDKLINFNNDLLMSIIMNNL
jgi:late competence protein required for DNA uptake (superfamily II DNA/RNA helicase)